MKRKMVEKGYDKLADWYYKDRLKTRGTSILLNKVIDKLPKKGKVLDLGCGVGYPVAKFFDDKKYNVIGIDISSKMLEIAKRIVPNAKFIKIDMKKINFKDNSFDIVISILSILHLPKKYHKILFKKIYKILKPNGKILIGMTSKDEGAYTNRWVKGVKMYWSSTSKKEGLKLIKEVGFKIVWNKEFGPKNDRHTYILAKK